MHILQFAAFVVGISCAALPLKERAMDIEPVKTITKVDIVTVTPAIYSNSVTQIYEDITVVTAAPIFVTVTERIVPGAASDMTSASASSFVASKGMFDHHMFHLPALPHHKSHRHSALSSCSASSEKMTTSVVASISGSTLSTLTTPKSATVKITDMTSPVSATSVVSRTASHGLQSSTSRAAITFSSTPAGSSGTTATSEAALPTNTIIQNLHPSDELYMRLALYSHNVHRMNHSDTEPLKYNMTLAKWAQQKVQTCIWDESIPTDALGVGMNIAEGTYIGAANITDTVEDLWYNGEVGHYPAYNVSNPDMSDFQNWGHFSQVVWRATTLVGCWSSACSRNDGTAKQIGSGFFTVCIYSPPGNVGGEYGDQVGWPKNQPTIHGV